MSSQNWIGQKLDQVRQLSIMLRMRLEAEVEAEKMSFRWNED